jgi:peptidoglycan/xylan/chitin deacetylase (PgdA/CDA1 family)
VKDTTRRIARRVLTSRSVASAVRTLAAARGHSLILVYHRVAPLRGHTDEEVVPTITPELFSAHLAALADVANIVSVETLLQRSVDHGHKPAVAVTFDDDLPSHTEQTLPLLRKAGVKATFFLSGRALVGMGPYWFLNLDALIRVLGAAETRSLLGVDPSDCRPLSVVCESTPELQERIDQYAATRPLDAVLDRSGIDLLREAGMEIGFHTAAHAVLTTLTDAGLTDALTHGRVELSAAAQRPLRYFAYPYGKADARCAAAVRQAGFDAAFTGRSEPVRRGVDRFRIGRWEPGAASVDDLLIRLAVRFHRSAPVRQDIIDG